MSEAALRDALREVDEPLPGRVRSLAATESKITLVASIGRSVGASTFALNLAQEKTATQSSLLLLDTNHSNPYLAQQLSAHGINREIYRTHHGFSIAELISHDSLQLISPALNLYDEIIVDYGQLYSPRKTLAGKRLYEEIFSWATQSNSTLIFLSRSDSRSLNQASQLINECSQSLPSLTPILLLTLNSVLSGRERGKLIKEASSQIQGKVRILSRASSGGWADGESEFNLAIRLPKERASSRDSGADGGRALVGYSFRMRVYLASTADELQEFLEDQSITIDEVYAPTPIYSATHPDLDEEEVEYSLSLLAAEDALDLMDDQSGAGLVLAFEIPEEMLGTFDEISATITAPIDWKMMEAIFLVGEDADDLTWFAPQEAESNLAEWLRG